METFEQLLEKSTKIHGHICAGQVIGVRMSMIGLREIGIDDPKVQRKEFYVLVEIDRCATDAIGVVTGCRLGKRSLKFLDFGKMAATFCDLEAGRAVRVAALESSKQRARELYPEIESKNEQQMRAYRDLPDADLFSHEWVTVEVGAQDLPGFKGPRVVCASCGEGISFQREVQVGEVTLCRACAGQAYYKPLPK